MLICVGLAVDYAAHIAHMFKDSKRDIHTAAGWKAPRKPIKSNENLIKSDQVRMILSL